MAADREAWLDEFFEAYFRSRPVDATFIGNHDHDGRLPDASERGLGDLRAETRSLLDELEALSGEPSSPVEAIDETLARGHLEIQAWELDSGHFHRRNPAWYTGEAIFGALSLLLRDAAPLEARLEPLASRLAAIPALLEQGVRNVEGAPRAWTERAMRECEAAIDFFDDGLPRITTKAEVERTAQSARRAFVELREHLEATLAREVDGAGAIGAEAFGLLLTKGHFLDWTADEIVERATERLSASEAELREGARRLGAPDVGAALGLLQELHPPRDRYYERFRDVWEESRAVAEKHALVTWPDHPVRYVARPGWARKAAPNLYFLFYRSPAPLEPEAPLDYLLTPLDPELDEEEAEAILRATNDSVIKLNHVVHHGGIGHHIQNWYARRAKSRIGRIAAVDGASRIAMFCGGTMAEGWATYVTDLMEEVGFLTALESYAEHGSRARAAARAIVDVKLHRGDMTFEQAERFYAERARMTAAASRAEVTKNGMFPGAAVLYFVGSTLIHELRRELGSALGERFDLGQFHDRFLAHGSIPVSLIGQSMRDEARGTRISK